MTTLVGRLTLEQRTDRALAKLREACIAGADDAYVIQLAERLARRVRDERLADAPRDLRQRARRRDLESIAQAFRSYGWYV